MDFLEREFAASRGKQPRDEARRALLETCLCVLDLGEKILRKFRDSETIDATLDRCITGGSKTVPWKELWEIAGSVGALETHFADARRAEEKRKARMVARASAPKSSPKARIKKTPIPKVIKDEIWDHYIGNTVASTLCPCCQKSMITMRDFVAGHVLAEKHGGGITCENLVPICNKCNSSMGARHMVEFTMKHWGRPPICPRNSVTCPLPPTDRISHVSTAPPKSQTFEHYKHARIFSGGHVDAGRFASDAEAVSYASAKGYKAIVHKSGGLAMYYFSDKPCKKPKTAKSIEESGWEYDSWRLL